MRVSVIAKLMVCMCVPAWASGSARLIIEPHALVKPSEMVRLGNIARVEGATERVEQLKSIEIARAPGPGASREITASWIRSRIRCAGVDPADVRLVIGEPDTSTRTGASERMVLTGRSQTVSGADIAEAARQAVMDRLGQEVKCAAEVGSRLPDMLVPEGDVDLVAQPRSQVAPAKSGRQWVSVAILVDGAQYASTLAAVDVKMFGPVLVATQSIRVGEALTERNTITEEREITTSTQALSELPAAGAVVAARAISAGTPIAASAVTTRPDVHRGDPVLVVVRSRGVKVAVRGTATRDAAAGSAVRVVMPWNKEEIQATVVEPGLAEVTLR